MGGRYWFDSGGEFVCVCVVGWGGGHEQTPICNRIHMKIVNFLRSRLSCMDSFKMFPIRSKIHFNFTSNPKSTGYLLRGSASSA